MATHESFLVYGRYRYAKLASALCTLVIALYALHDPLHGPNGGTWLGYSLGSLGALLVLILAWFGVRKRAYVAGRGQVKAWLSAHVYLGLALLLIATLHTGFQFSPNVHLLAYLLLLIVIVSGLYGIIAYARYPQLITTARRNRHPVQMAQEIRDLDERALRLADQLDAQLHDVVLRSIQATRIARSWREQLFGVPRSVERLGQEAEKTLRDRHSQMTQIGMAQPAAESSTKTPAGGGRGGRATMFFVASRVVDAGQDRSTQSLARLLELINRKKSLVTALNRDIQQRARLQIWLYVHVPASIALIGALLVHVFTVLAYR